MQNWGSAWSCLLYNLVGLLSLVVWPTSQHLCSFDLLGGNSCLKPNIHHRVSTEVSEWNLKSKLVHDWPLQHWETGFSWKCEVAPRRQQEHFCNLVTSSYILILFYQLAMKYFCFYCWASQALPSPIKKIIDLNIYFKSHCNHYFLSIYIHV